MLVYVTPPPVGYSSVSQSVRGLQENSWGKLGYGPYLYLVSVLYAGVCSSPPVGYSSVSQSVRGLLENSWGKLGYGPYLYLVSVLYAGVCNSPTCRVL